MPFDLNGARREGYADKDILSYLAGRDGIVPEFIPGSDEEKIAELLRRRQAKMLPYEYASGAPAPGSAGTSVTPRAQLPVPPAPASAGPVRQNIPPDDVRALWEQGQQGMQPAYPMSLLDLAVNNPVSEYIGEALTAAGQKLGDLNPALLAVAAPTLLGMVRKGKPSQRGSVIKDWQWLPAKTVKETLGLSELPKHIEPFGRFMQEQSAKAAAGELSTRDLIKAFTVTRASIQRSAIGADKVRKAGLDIAAEGKIRPEGAFSEWLLTPMGKRYLDAAETGVVDEEAVASAVNVMRPFGKADQDIPDALRWAAQNLPGREKELAPIIARASGGEKQLNNWRQATSDLKGIGLAKQGFVGSLLGYGQLPTLDARQIKLHTGQPTSEAQQYLRRNSGLGGQQAVDRLAARQEGMNVQMPPEMQPYYQHLTHHAAWDKVANEATTHEDLIRAMKLAGMIGGAVTAPLLLRPRTLPEMAEEPQY